MTVPKLRFKEFDENWRLLTLKQLINSLDAGVSVISEDIMPLDDEYSVLKTSCISLGYFNKNERKRVIKSKEIQRLKEPVLDDSIIISRMNTPLLVGMNAYVDKAPANTFLPDRLWQIKINNDLVMTLWLSFYLGSDGCLYKLRDLASGTSNSMKNITKPGVLSINLFVPSKEEQTKIASFLSSVDDKITQLTQEHELLSEFKKGMMQQLFSQTMRFKADDGSDFEDWEERTLGEVSTTFSGGTPTSSNKLFYEGQIPFIKSGEISQSNTAQFINELALANSSAKLVKKGDLLYALYGATSGQVAIAQLEGAINQAVLCIRSKTLVTNYLYNFLLFKKEEILSTYLQGGQGNLSASILKEIDIPTPCLEEQTKIANFLSAIDQKIDNVAAQIDQAKIWKKGLLQQMFV